MDADTDAKRNLALTVVMVWLAVSAIGGGVFDIVQYSRFGNHATISYAMNWAGSQWPIIPCLYGVIAAGLAAHFWTIP
jgi:hypothetical protein